jgi:hypothetical protein
MVSAFGWEGGAGRMDCQLEDRSGLLKIQHAKEHPEGCQREKAVNADSDESGHLFQSISDTVPILSDSCRSEATL